MNIERSLVIIIFILHYALQGQAQTPANDSHWINIWSDTFKTFSSVHPNGSGYYIGKDSADHRWQVSDNYQFGNAPQAYMKEQITFDADGLVITTEKVATYTCTSCLNNQVFNYKSGNITRWGNYPGPKDTEYGYIEARIKIEKDVYGLWPAFWMWNDVCTCNSPDATMTTTVCTTCSPPGPNMDYDEIDIFELTPGMKEGCESAGYKDVIQDKNIIRTNIHTSDNESCGANPRGQNLPINDYTNWHTYGVEWSPSKIIFYIDNIAVRTSPNPNYPNNVKGDVSQKLAIILGSGLNDALRWVESDGCGGNNTFWQNINGCGNNGSTTYFNSTTYSPADINTTPAKMHVDYVSYYKLNNGNCNLSSITVTDATENTCGADNNIASFLITSGTISLDSSPHIWRARDFLLINGDFDSNGKELYLDVNPCPF